MQITIAKALHNLQDMSSDRLTLCNVLLLLLTSQLCTNAHAGIQNKDGWTALHEAAMKGAIQVAQFLLDYGADPAICTNEGDTPLHKAARWNHLGITRLLLANGADAAARDKVRLYRHYRF